MKRAEILARLGFSVPEASKIRVIVDTDAKNEADDQYAITHFLLSPTMDIMAVTAAHFEGKAAPEIGERITAVWNGGGPYPAGRQEFNVAQDPEAARALLASTAQVWQIPQDVYASFEVTLAELFSRVQPCGRIGEYLCRQLEEDNLREFDSAFLLRAGENWTLGDNATVAALLMSRFRGNWRTRPAPKINDGLTYEDDPEGKEIRVYTSLDTRMALEDLFAKLALVYGRN